MRNACVIIRIILALTNITELFPSKHTTTNTENSRENEGHCETPQKEEGLGDMDELK